MLYDKFALFEADSLPFHYKIRMFQFAELLLLSQSFFKPEISRGIWGIPILYS